MILFLSNLLNYLRFMINPKRFGHPVKVSINKYDFVRARAVREDLGYSFVACFNDEVSAHLSSVGARVGRLVTRDDVYAEIRGDASVLRKPWVNVYFPTAETAIIFKMKYL